MGDNISALEVKGSFDDCQRMVKEAFVDKKLNSMVNLTSANSINIGRLIPQAFYYVYGFSRLRKNCGEICFTVPSGNFGNLTAGIYAWRWECRSILLSRPRMLNDVVPEYLDKGVFSPRSSVLTLSNAMDVGNPSNFERLKAVFGGDLERMKAIIHGEVINDEETLETIARIYEEYGIFVDPHTAVGILASERSLRDHWDGRGTSLRFLPRIRGNLPR